MRDVGLVIDWRLSRGTECVRCAYFLAVRSAHVFTMLPSTSTVLEVTGGWVLELWKPTARSFQVGVHMVVEWGVSVRECVDAQSVSLGAVPALPSSGELLDGTHPSECELQLKN